MSKEQHEFIFTGEEISEVIDAVLKLGYDRKLQPFELYFMLQQTMNFMKQTYEIEIWEIEVSQQEKQ